MTPEEQYEWIERYLEDQLGGEELDIFRKRLRDDSEFAYDVEIQRLIWQQIKEQRKQELKNFIAAEGEVKYIQNIWGTKWLYASAAIVLFFTGFYFVVEYVIKPGQESGTYSVGQEEYAREKSDSSTVVDPMREPDQQKKSFPSQADSVVDLAIADHDDVPTDEVVKETMPVIESSEDYFFDQQRDSADLYEDEDFVAKDERIAGKVFELHSLVSVSRENAAKKAPVSKQVTTDKSETEEPREQEKSISETKESAQLIVEFWKSPVNYKGYSYQKGKLILFGIDPTESLHFVQGSNGTIYMKRNGVWWIIQNNVQDKPFNKLTDPEILKLLTH